MTSSLQKLQHLLRRLFRLDEPRDLDFGIHRVINLKRERLSEYVDNKLPTKVAEILKESGGEIRQAKTDELQRSRDWAVEVLGPRGLDADGKLTDPAFAQIPAGENYLRAQQDALHLKPAEKMQEEIYDHLASFFARYECGGGDIVPRRRHSVQNQYALPHNGEEVLLHWANRDQYYIKTAALHSGVAFKADGKRFRFQISETQDIPRDNNKDGRFLLPQIAKAAKNESGDIVVPFVFRALSKAEQTRHAEAANGENGNGSKVQRGILAAALADLKKAAEKNPDLRPMLKSHMAQAEKSVFAVHAARFVRRNNADFFIHRNLRKFLSEELDFYLKNEALNAEELAGLNGFAVAARMVVFCAVRKIAADIIDALAEWENLQKSLWEKKKFILQTEYCATLGHIPNAEKSGILKDIAGCEKQWAEWEAMGVNGEAAALFSGNGKGKREKRAAYLRDNPSLPVDTANFPPEFKERLLAQFSDIDDATDGVLIHGENWQALNLIQGMYRGRVKCVYIDPPYNTDMSPILYKNDYKHSSWLSMMDGRLRLTPALMTANGVLCVAIDDEEIHHLKLLMDGVLGKGRHIGTVAVQSNPGGRDINTHFAISHEYCLFYANAEQQEMLLPREVDATGEKTGQFRRTGGLASPEERENSEFAFYYEPNDLTILGVGGKRVSPFPADYEPTVIHCLDAQGEGVELNPSDFFAAHPSVKTLLPVFKNGDRGVWRWSDRGKILSAVKQGKICISNRHGKISARLTSEVSPSYKPKTIWADSAYSASVHGTVLLQHILGEKGIFSYPKSINTVQTAVAASMHGHEEGFALDYFAGSGTTAHAVVNLNREDGGRRKFVLAEMGKYFNTVLLPRVKKITYAPEWKDGKAVRPATREEFNRGPRLVKYQRIESYEDTLANIKFESGGLDLEKFAPRYELDWESRKRPTRLIESDLESPFSYALELTMGNGENGEKTRTETADLPETFAYLIGLRVRTREVAEDNGRRYLIQRGMSEEGETAVIWRDTKGWTDKDYERDRAFIRGGKFAEGASWVLVNGGSTLKKSGSLNPVFGDKMFPAEKGKGEGEARGGKSASLD